MNVGTTRGPHILSVPHRCLGRDVCGGRRECFLPRAVGVGRVYDFLSQERSPVPLIFCWPAGKPRLLTHCSGADWSFVGFWVVDSSGLQGEEQDVKRGAPWPLQSAAPGAVSRVPGCSIAQSSQWD